ncbi:MAG TPA: type II secretion system F family protein [Phycisphaerales bacterium]|nr:type II secretion system F family protein [Phycisphaerales bacterium]
MSESVFKYVAVDGAGARRRGVVRASGEQEAFRRIASMGLTPFSLRPARERTVLLRYRGTTLTDIAALTRELSVLIEARIPIEEGLNSIAESEKRPVQREMIRDIAARILAGATISEAIDQHRQTFGEVYVETVRAAERTGSLISVTSHLADMLERQVELRQQLKRALAYPVIVVGVVALAVSVIIVFVVPRFAETFASSDVQLPLTTRAIQALAASVRSHWWAYLGTIVGAAFACMAAWKTEGGRAFFERAFRIVPFIEKTLVAVTTARFARVFGIALGSGLGVTESIEMGGRATGRPLFAQECNAIADRLRGGEALKDAIEAGTYLPSFARRMISAGKDSAELSRSCGVVAKHYEREAEHLTKGVGQVIEPLLTVALAVIVLVIALSVFLPMWQMVKINH